MPRARLREARRADAAARAQRLRVKRAAAAGAVSPLRVVNSILLLTLFTLQLTAFISCRVLEVAASSLQQAAQAARSNPHGTQLLLPPLLVSFWKPYVVFHSPPSFLQLCHAAAAAGAAGAARARLVSSLLRFSHTEAGSQRWSAERAVEQGAG